MSSIKPGTRVVAFDSRLYVNDILTPLTKTMRSGTVVKRYIYESLYGGRTFKDDLCDILFDHNPKVSGGHFTDGLKLV